MLNNKLKVKNDGKMYSLFNYYCFILLSKAWLEIIRCILIILISL